MQRLVLNHSGEDGMWYKSAAVADFYARGGEFMGCTFTPIPDSEVPMQSYYMTADGGFSERGQPGAIRHEYRDGDRLYVDLPPGQDAEAMCAALTAHFCQFGMPSGRAFYTETVEEMRAWREELLKW